MKKFALFVILTATAFAGADGTQPDGIGSLDWFSWTDFGYGWAAAWSIIGPAFIYWFMKRSTSNALE